MKQLISTFYLILLFIGNGQTQPTLSKDSSKLSFEEYLEIVLAEHPLARQAELQTDFAAVEQLKARGVIDPKISMSFDSKNFDDKDYYDLLRSEIKVPTVLGLDLKANFESAAGDFINPENFTTNRGLWSAGLEMDVLRDFAYNERKAAFDRADVFQEQSINIQNLQLNDLLIRASIAYLDWYTATENVKIVEENLELSEIYLVNIRDAVLLGDKPAIDTVEAKTILLDQLVIYQEQELKRVKAKFNVNNFLWDGNQMIFLSEESNPSEPTFMEVLNTVNLDLFLSHPEVLEKQIKLDQLDITRMLAKQQLLPELKLGYNPLVPTNSDTFLPADTEIANYKIGASFAVPLFRRKEKAELQKTDLKLTSTQLELDNKANELFIKWNIEDNNFSNLQEQINFLQEAQSNYEALADAELIRYNYGESSVFLVNKRLEKVIENRLKIQKLIQSQFEARVMQLYFQNDLLP